MVYLNTFKARTNNLIYLTGISMEVFAIINGNISPYVLDPHLSHKLPIIPSEVGYVNFTWKSCCKKYYYHFDTLTSSDPMVLKPPILSIKTKGRVPKRARGNVFF